MSRLIILLAIIFVLGCNSKVESDKYGDELSEAHTLEAVEMVSLMSQTDSAAMKVEATIIETCEKKGCWMTVRLPNEEEMRVTFKDYGFFVPKTGVEGKKVIFEGTAMRSVTDAETLRHFAEDAGKSPEDIAKITEPQTELSFVATGVEIPKGQE